MWMRVGWYRSTYSAKSAAREICGAYTRPTYAPAGSFEARAEFDGDGAAVIARYIGATS
jgi:hypothetical protein